MKVFDYEMGEQAAPPLPADPTEISQAQDATRVYPGMESAQQALSEADIPTCEMPAITIPREMPVYPGAKPNQASSRLRRITWAVGAVVVALGAAYLAVSAGEQGPTAPVAVTTTIGQLPTTEVPTTSLLHLRPDTTAGTVAASPTPTTPTTRESAPTTTIAEPRVSISIPDVQKIIQDALTGTPAAEQTTTTVGTTTTNARATTTTQATTSTTRLSPTTTVAALR